MKRYRTLFLVIIYLYTQDSVAVGILYNSIERNHPVDSLLHILTSPVSDTIRSNVLMALGNYYQYVNPDSAIFYHTRAKQLINSFIKSSGLKNKTLTELKLAEMNRQLGGDCYLAGYFCWSDLTYRIGRLNWLYLYPF